jgi:alanine racemase
MVCPGRRLSLPGLGTGVFEKASSVKALPRSWVEIDGRALAWNLRFLRRRIGRRARLFAVVKSDAYGHGMLAVARELQALGVDGLAVANPQEGGTLRKNGVRVPILVLGPCLREEWEEVLSWKLTPVISTYQEARELEAAARRLRTPAEVHLAVDTGMGREGQSGDEFFSFWEKLRSLFWIRVLGLFSHFACADSDAEATRAQWEKFQWYREKLGLPIAHMANSAGVSLDPTYAMDWARVGLALYGVSPWEDIQAKLLPVLSWRARVSLLRWMPPGSTISYGCTYRLQHPERIATVTVGYGDGYPWSLSNRGHVLLRGVLCPLRGRVTMDQILVDASKVPSAKRGDVVTLLGRSRGKEIRAKEIADVAGILPYEVFTRISPRLPRVYKNFQSLEQGSERKVEGVFLASRDSTGP